MQYQVPQFPESVFYISLVKLNNVELANSILTNISKYEFCIIDAKTLYSLSVLYSAIYRLLLDKNFNKLKTRNWHSELLFELSNVSNISKSISNFGIKKDSDYVVCVSTIPIHFKNDFANTEIEEFTLTQEQLDSIRDVKEIKKVCININPVYFIIKFRFYLLTIITNIIF